MALSNDKLSMAVTNMQDGVDVYDFDDELVLRYNYHSPINPSLNCILQVAFAESDSRIVSGTHFGKVLIWDSRGGDAVQTILHGESEIALGII